MVPSASASVSRARGPSRSSEGSGTTWMAPMVPFAGRDAVELETSFCSPGSCASRRSTTPAVGSGPRLDWGFDIELRAGESWNEIGPTLAQGQLLCHLQVLDWGLPSAGRPGCRRLAAALDEALQMGG